MTAHRTAFSAHPVTTATSGLERGVQVTVTLTDGALRHGLLVSLDEDGLTLRRHVRERPWRIDWPDIRRLRVGAKGVQRGPDNPTQIEAIQTLVASRGTDGIAAVEAHDLLKERYGFDGNSLRVARRRAGVVSYFDRFWGEWRWAFGDPTPEGKRRP